MLQQANRLKANAKFKKIYLQGTKYYTPYFLLFILPEQNSRQVFGFVASKKIGGAVERNRSKRLLRQAIRELLPGLTGNFSAVVIASNKAPGAKLADIKGEMEKTLVKAGLMQKLAD